MKETKQLRRKTIALIIDSLAGGGSYQEDLWHSVAAACEQKGTGILIFPGGALGGNPFGENEHMKNLIYMELPSEYGFIYETIVSQLCIAIYGARLVEKNIRARTAIEEHNRRIEELTLPMIESIGKISGIVMANMESAHSLVDQTKKSLGKISETNTNIEKITAHTNKLLEIIQIIEEISEKVNLLALNTAIEAAHVGKTGAGFTIISKEIKKLAENSRQHSKEIAITLKEIIASANDSSLNGHESMEVFHEQEKKVDEIFNSFQTISEKIQELGTGSETILDLIQKK